MKTTFAGLANGGLMAVVGQLVADTHSEWMLLAIAFVGSALIGFLAGVEER